MAKLLGSLTIPLLVYVMGPIEKLCINVIDVPHASGQAGIRGLDQDMKNDCSANSGWRHADSTNPPFPSEGQ